MPRFLCGAIDERALLGPFDATTRARGLEYAEKGRVLRLDVEGNGHYITARVEGSRLEAYTVLVALTHANGSNRLHIDGRCSCPVEWNCKHVVAVLAEAIVQRDTAVGDPRAVSARPPQAAQTQQTQRDRRVEVWLANIDENLKQSAAATGAGDAVVYLLSTRPNRALHIALATAKHKVDGSWGKPRVFTAEAAVAGQGRMLTPDDMQAARLLTGLDSYGARYVGDCIDAALRLIVPTGRAFWNDTQRPVTLGQPCTAELGWTVLQDGTQRLDAFVAGERVNAAFTNRAWMLAEGDELRELTFTLENSIVVALLSGPPVADADAPSVAARLETLKAPKPRSSVAVNVVADPPAPHLVLAASTRKNYGWRAPDALPDAVARITFAYGDARISPESSEREWRTTTTEGITIRRRDTGAEAAAIAELQARGLREQMYSPPGTFEPVRVTPRFWTNFVLAEMPALAAQGWRIEIDDSFPYRIVQSDAPWEVEASGSEEVELDITLDVEGKRVPLVPLLTKALESGTLQTIDGRTTVGPLEDGTIVSLQADRLQRLIDVIVEVFDRPDSAAGRVRVPLSRALALDALGADAHIEGLALARIREAARRLVAPQQTLPKLPRTLKATLRPYQHEGFAWLQRLREAGFGGVLADSMGLGKTVQTLAHLLAENKAGRLTTPALVVAPTSLLPNWHAEAERFAPSLRTLVLHGARREERHAEIDHAQLVVTSYALLVRDADMLTAREWSIAILDEAQNIKNASSKTAKAARSLKAEQRLCLTGTPVENHLDELWSLYAFAEPGLLGDRDTFRKTFRTPIEKRNDEPRRKALAGRIAPFLRRRTKEVVAADLPEKMEILTRVELGERQRDLYETIRAAMHARVREAIEARGLARSRIVVLDALLKLRQVCCHPSLLGFERSRGVSESAKLDALREMLEELVSDGRRILLFSQFTSMLRLIEQQLAELEIPYVQLTGQTQDRATPVARFQAGEVPLFLISLKAGGTGLNLTAADTVIHYDPWWNPAVERQATDRAHRIGQDKSVFVYKLVCESTIEERILDLQARKGAVADALLDDAATALTLDPEELTRLFE
jgi:superfamily II DNA or RNA helicase